MTVFVLKVIAMTTMVIDHVGFQLMDNNFLMRSIGRLAFIIYAFLIAEGFYHMKNRPDRLKSHVIKLMVLCLVTEIAYDLFDHEKWVDFGSQSVLATLLLGFMALIACGWWKRQYGENRMVFLSGSVIICFAAASASFFIRSEYAFAGVLLIVLFYLYLQKADDMDLPMRLIALVGVFAVYFAVYIWRKSGFSFEWPQIITAAKGLSPLFPGMACTIIPLTLYNRELGYHSKWFDALYSCFYPLQFVILVIIRYFIRGY